MENIRPAIYMCTFVVASYFVTHTNGELINRYSVIISRTKYSFYRANISSNTKTLIDLLSLSEQCKFILKYGNFLLLSFMVTLYISYYQNTRYNIFI